MATGTARRRGLRLAATLTVVVLALTGFQTSSSGGKGGSGKSKSRSGSSGGGGCSSSKKKNNDYDYDDDLSDSGGSGGSDPYPTDPTPTVTSSSAPAEVTVVDCVKFAQKKSKGRPARKADTTASVRITSRASVTQTFRVELEFQDAGGMKRDEASKDVTVGPGETRTFNMAMESPSAVDRVRTCEIAGVSVQ